ncbi:MAG: hypothetical protein ACI89L_000687 [Phycisphaerales bacterium]|jgi:hypothetical protein
MHMPTATMLAFAMPMLVGVLAQATERSAPTASALAQPAKVAQPTKLTDTEPQRRAVQGSALKAAAPVEKPGNGRKRISPLQALQAPALQPRISLREPMANALLAGDTYTCEALAQDATAAYFIDDTGGSIFQFDGAVEIGGSSSLDPSVTFIIYEGRTELGSTTLIQIEMGAYNTAGESQPWVDASAAGAGLESWRLDIGTNEINDPDPITLEGPFTVVGSGMAVFGTDGSLLGESPLLRDDSTSTGLAGVATVGLGGEDIAGFGLGAMQMWWEIKFDNTTGPGPCVADINGDGYVDISDIQAFVNSFLAGCP